MLAYDGQCTCPDAAGEIVLEGALWYLIPGEGGTKQEASDILHAAILLQVMCFSLRGDTSCRRQGKRDVEAAVHSTGSSVGWHKAYFLAVMEGAEDANESCDECKGYSCHELLAG